MNWNKFILPENIRDQSLVKAFYPFVSIMSKIKPHNQDNTESYKNEAPSPKIATTTLNRRMLFHTIFEASSVVDKS